MPIKVSSHLRGWLENDGLENYLQVVEAEPHPDVMAIIRHIDAKQITNRLVHHFLNLKNEGYNEMDNLEEDVLQSYFGPYLASAKSHLINGAPDVFFQDVAKFLLVVAFSSAQGYCIPKRRAGFIIAAYEEATVDWGCLMAKPIREQINNVKKGKSM